MDKYIINGGNKLDGKVIIESSKNSVLPILAASILTNDEVIIQNCPKIKDVLNMIKILKSLGVKTSFQNKNLLINASTLNNAIVPKEITGELRASIYMLGALLSRCKKAELYYPGGCNIGDRPINLHIMGLKMLGAKIKEDSCKIEATCDIIKNNKVFLPYPSVGATVNIILASVLGAGTTSIANPAKEPEIVDFCNFLNKMGAKITGYGSDTIYITGVKRLHGCTFKPISDRIEAGTFLISAAITSGNIEVCNIDAKNIFPLLNKLCDNTCKIDIKNDIIHIKGAERRRAFTLETAPYPSFPTDLQAQMMALSTVSIGYSFINETVFEARFNHVSELIKMGADIFVKENVAIIKGVPNLKGTTVKAFDLRGGAALVLAGLVAKDTTIVENVYHISRGYLDFDKKLKELGADISFIRK